MTRLKPIFLVLVVIQALLVILEKAGLVQSVPRDWIALVRITLAVAIIGILIVWTIDGWRASKKVSP